MSHRRSIVAAPALAVVLLLAVAAGLLLPASAAVADDRRPARAYGAWSSYYGDLRARISLPDARNATLSVQVNRRSDSVGERQVRLSWRPAGGSVRTSPVRAIGRGATLTLATSALPCGRTTAVSLSARGRASGGAWGEWQSVSGNIRRAC